MFSIVTKQLFLSTGDRGKDGSTNITGRGRQSVAWRGNGGGIEEFCRKRGVEETRAFRGGSAQRRATPKREECKVVRHALNELCRGRRLAKGEVIELGSVHACKERLDKEKCAGTTELQIWCCL
jgi:hypothetical protein